MPDISRIKVICVVGARPNFTKIAPIMRAFSNSEYGVSAYLVHTGQHYDEAMKQAFFDQLGIPEPDIDLGVGSGSHAVQTAEVMKSFEVVMDEQQPDAILVVGDVNSTIACALVAVKKAVPVIHVESGLRSGDRAMPEEINRILTDQISDLLFLTERSAETNLIREGIDPSRIHFVGNVMIDTLMYNLSRAVSPATTLTEECGLSSEEIPERFALLTLHRPSNVDCPDTLKMLLETVAKMSEQLPIVFPIHPRTQQRIKEAGLEELISSSRFITMPPAGYLQLLGLMKGAKVVLTDSGGIQEETTALGVPCLTLRESTERPITVDEGTNTIVGIDPEVILDAFQSIMDGSGKHGRVPEYWDGKAAERIAQVLQAWAGERTGSMEKNA